MDLQNLKIKSLELANAHFTEKPEDIVYKANLYFKFLTGELVFSNNTVNQDIKEN